MTRAPRRTVPRRHTHPRLIYLVIICAALLLVRFITSHTLGSLSTISTRNRRHAKLAFFIQVSNSSFLLLPRLLKALWHRNNLYLIHIDAKLPLNAHARAETFIREHDNYRLGNVLILESEHISYAGISMLLNTINAISLLLRTSADWDFFINLSGSDYPLVSPTDLRALLASPSVLFSGLNFLQRQAADNSMEWFFNRRFRQVHIDTSLWANSSKAETAELLALNATHPVSRQHTSFVKTEGWVILHRSFATHIVDSAQSRRLLLRFANARAADELFFGTLLIESARFRKSAAWDALRFVLWGMNGKHWGRPGFLDEVDEASTIISLMKQSGALFARKFANPESSVLDYIDYNMSGTAEFDYLVDENAIQQYIELVRKRLLCISTQRENSLCSLSRVV